MDKQYIYIFTNPQTRPDLVKVGRSDQNPHIRAKQLSRTVPGEYVVEWYMEVPDSKDAKRLAHITLKKHHDQKEYFKIGIIKAVSLVKKVITDLFEIDEPVCFEGDFLREINKKQLPILKVISAVKQRAKLILLEQDAEQEAEQLLVKFQEEQPSNLSVLGSLDRLEQFVNEVYERWSQKQTGLNGLTTKEIGDDGEQYVMKMMREKQGFNVVPSPYSRMPVDAFGIKWRGHFWHFIMIQIKTSTTKVFHGLTGEEYVKIREFGRFIKDEYLNSELYINYRDRPVVFSIGLAKVKNYRPTVNRCTLADTEFINWYWSNLSREKTSRIKILVEEAHSLKY